MADQGDACPWDPTNWGVKNDAAGQAWYDSLIRQYAGWGVDLIKVDCISSHPYKIDEIRMIHRAIVKTGRPMVLSLSPGPTALENAAEVGAESQMWRISDDFWDYWTNPKPWPRTVLSQFETTAQWEKYAKPGNWPDADMLPLGHLGPNPGEGKPRTTRLTHDEQRTVMTLWSMARSPLILGANLTELDAWTTALITNAGVIAVDQHSVENHMVGKDGNVVAWTAKASGASARGARYLALFNQGDAAVQVDSAFAKYGLGEKAKYSVRDLWEKKDLGVKTGVSLSIPAHGAVLLELRP